MNYLFHPSTLILLLANLFAIYQVWASGWSVYVVLLVYVIQGIIIGILHYIKILGLKQFTAKDWANGISVVENGKKVDIESRGADNARKMSANFFLLTYMLFHGVYLIFIFIFLAVDPFSIQTGASAVSPISQFFTLGFVIAVMGFLVTHLISFFMFKEEAKNITNPNTFVFEPLPRILPVHLTIILGMFIFLYIPQESSVLFFFLGLKTLIDILMHDWQHEKHDVLKNTQKAQISA